MQNGNEKKAGLSIVISDKVDFKTKAIKNNKEGKLLELLYCNDKRIVTIQEDITVINTCAPNRGASRYINTNRAETSLC